jgi:hypothetical protein
MAFMVLALPQKRAAPGEAAAGGTGRGAAAKKAKTNTGAAAAAAGAGGEGGIEIDGVGAMTEAELAGWAQNGQVNSLLLYCRDAALSYWRMLSYCFVILTELCSWRG